MCVCVHIFVCMHVVCSGTLAANVAATNDAVSALTTASSCGRAVYATRSFYFHFVFEILQLAAK